MLDLHWKSLINDITQLGGYVGPIHYEETTEAGRRLVAAEDVEASAMLACVPKEALVNLNTIRAQYPEGIFANETQTAQTALNSTQALSMHLASLKRRLSDNVDVYFATLPLNFDGHPLTWLVDDAPNEVKQLLDYLPPPVRRVVKEVYQRYLADWAVVQNTWTNNPFNLDPATISNTQSDFLWAWLCVNTRCIHYSLDTNDPMRSKKDVDLTMGPIIDFANHTVISRQGCEVLRDHDGVLQMISPAHTLKKGDEIFFHYNNHSNAVLFSEYGFVLSRVALADAEADTAEVKVDDIVEALFQKDGQSWKQQLLQDEGYWGDWSLYLTPRPAHPSYRLLPAIRLLHVGDPPPESSPPRNSALSAWKSMVQGNREIVDQPNETATRNTLRTICDDLVQRSEAGSKRLDAAGLPSADWVPYAAHCIQVLWQEEHAVAQAVRESIDSGIEF